MHIVLIGGSSGSLKPVRLLLRNLNGSNYVVIIILHLPSQIDLPLVELLAVDTKLPVKEAIDKSLIDVMNVYVAAGGYHLYIEDDHSFALSLDEKVNYSRPSIDVLFSSAADVYGQSCIGILLSGANKDGAEGLKRMKQLGGMTIAQLPTEAEVSEMPKSAIDTGSIDLIATVDDIAIKINQLMNKR